MTAAPVSAAMTDLAIAPRTAAVATTTSTATRAAATTMTGAAAMIRTAAVLIATAVSTPATEETMIAAGTAVAGTAAIQIAVIGIAATTGPSHGTSIAMSWWCATTTPAGGPIRPVMPGARHVGYPLPREVVYYELPPELLVRLEPVPYGHRYVQVDNDILMIVIPTGLIVDILEDFGSG